MPITISGATMSGGVVFASPLFENGLYRRRYSGYFADDVNWFDTATLVDSAVNTSPINDGFEGDSFSVQWLGYFLATTTETYTFYTTSDDASYLWIGSTALQNFTTSNATVNNGGLHGPIEQSGTSSLVAGTYYPIRMQMGELGGGDVMEVRISTPTIVKTTDLSPYIFYNVYTNGF
jgi:hypothetical protein